MENATTPRMTPIAIAPVSFSEDGSSASVELAVSDGAPAAAVEKGTCPVAIADIIVGERCRVSAGFKLARDREAPAMPEVKFEYRLRMNKLF
jgi:hypothetical protein